jgi:hypothetical protein
MSGLRAAIAAAAITAGLLCAAPAAPAAARTCSSECVQWQGDTAVNPAWFQARWHTNAGGWYVRGVANCGDGRQTVLKLGGWVTSVGTWSRATCPSSLPVLVGGAFDSKRCSSCAYSRQVEYGHL